MAPLFESVLYYIPECVPEDRRIDLSRLLDENGACPAETVATANHVITTTLDFPGVDSVPNTSHLATPYWVERSVMVSMKQNPRYYSPNPIHVFSGVIACASDIPKGDKEAISAGILALGGQWREGLTKEVSHLFCLVPDGLKYRTAMSHREITRIVVLLPHWFDDCFKTQMLLPTTQYEFPDPPMFNPDKATVNTATVKSLLDKPRKQVTGPDVWHGKKILLSDSLQLEDGRRQSVELMIERAGGVIQRVKEGEREDDVVEHVDLLVTRWRKGQAYSKAVQKEISVGTLAYVLEVLNSGVVTVPTDNLLHYPTRSWDVPAFESQTITITNYSGAAREYLRNLIQIMGATFTPTLSSKNTVVIAAHTTGSKTDKAKEWRIPIVSHIWLEDCFTEWKFLSPAMTQYLTFPPGVNYMEVVGSRSLGRIGPESLAELEMETRLINAEKEKALAKKKAEEVETKKAVEDAYQKGVTEGSKKPAVAAGMKVNTLKKPATLNDNTRVPQALRTERSFVASGTSAKEAMEVEQAVTGAEEDIWMDGPPPDVDDGGVPNAMDVDPPDEEPEPETGLTDLYRNPSSHPVVVQKASPKKKSSFGPASRQSKDKAPPSTALKETSANSLSGDKAGHDTDAAKGKKPSTGKRTSDGSRDTRENRTEMGEEEEESSIPGLGVHKKPSTGNKALDTASKKPAGGKRTGDSAKKNVVRELFGEPETVGFGHESTSTPSKPSLSKRNPEQLHRQPSGRILSVEIVRATSPPKADANDGASASNAAGKTKKPVEAAPTPSSRPKKAIGPRPTWANDASRSKKDAPGPSKTKGKQRPPTTPPSDEEEKHSPNQDEEMEEIQPFSFSRQPSRRGAAVKASQMLGAAMADANSFQREMQRGTIEVPRATTSAATSKRRRKEMETTAVDGDSDRGAKKRRVSKSRGDEGSDGETPMKIGKSKKPILEWDPSDPTASKVNPSKIQLVITQVLLSAEETLAVGKMGARIIKDFTDVNQKCTHLVAKAIQRTEKFLCAISSGPDIVTAEWLKDSISAGRFLAEDNYLLRDSANESRYDVDIGDSVRRARRNPKKLLQGHTFYATERFPMEFDALKRIVGAAGGTVEDQRKPTLRMLHGRENRHVLADPLDIAIWRSLRVEGMPIYSKEMILNVILRQEVDWDDESLPQLVL